MKNKLKEFFGFETMVTEKVLKYLFAALVGISAVFTVGSILVSWVGAVRIIRWSFGGFLTGLLVMPLLTILGFALGVLFLRISFETVLILFRIYAELKKVNQKED